MIKLLPIEILLGICDRYMSVIIPEDVFRYLFPFTRQILVDATLHCGFPPVFIQPIDFAALYHQRQEQGQQTKATS
jgi:preprotein translocase subunit SecB